MESIEIKLSEIQIGDKFNAGNATYVAESKPYFNGVWRVDIGNGLAYGWNQFDEQISVLRKSSKI